MISALPGPAVDQHALTAPDPAVRLTAYRRASGFLVRSGERAEVSVQAVPALLELVRDPGVVDKDATMMLLCDIAVGQQVDCLEDPPDWPARRREVARKQRLSVADLEREAEQRERARGTAHLAERLEMLGLEDQDLNRELERAGVRAYDQVRAGMPTFVELLRSPNPLYRLYAAYLVAFFPEDRDTTAPALAELLGKDEAAPGITATASVAAGMIGMRGDRRLIDALERHLAGDDQIERWGAAIGLSALLHDPDADVLVLVDECCFDGPSEIAYFPFLDGELHDVAVCFYLRARPRAPAARSLLLRRLAEPSLVEHSLRLVVLALEEFFPQVRTVPPPYALLSEEQRQVCRSFARHRVLDTVPTARNQLARHGLPATQPALEEWIAADRLWG
ncbi:hypothetical protein [Asanoa siamensis]|uniref:HEAT repeat protein n=1 Tax=Asanoa siamensis TaxID=926357 RepID=A0ABQ4D433_9ACTN|nr:hypothetical protein [Asanoa siamensis]GIF78287.1 hypothetical protein Asi02nite_78050 [Asanoa siamensis]